MPLFLFTQHTIVVEKNNDQTRVVPDDSHGPQSGTLPTLWQSKLQAGPRTSRFLCLNTSPVVARGHVTHLFPVFPQKNSPPDAYGSRQDNEEQSEFK
jgi:hypothetical protein